jgi:hypothetical protein
MRTQQDFYLISVSANVTLNPETISFLTGKGNDLLIGNGKNKIRNNLKQGGATLSITTFSLIVNKM